MACGCILAHANIDNEKKLRVEFGKKVEGLYHWSVGAIGTAASSVL